MAKALCQAIFTFALDVPDGAPDDWVNERLADQHPFELVEQAISDGDEMFSASVTGEIVEEGV